MDTVVQQDTFFQVNTAQLQQLVHTHLSETNEGTVASYIPELQQANANHLGLSVCSLDDDIYAAGDAHVPFSMQSISKIFALALSLMDNGEEAVFEKVGMEPTGDPFNSIVKLEERKPSKPLNPMINAGAIAVTSSIKGNSVDEKFERLLHFVQQLCRNDTITYNERVAYSELMTADLNRALAYFMREHHVIHGDIEAILDLYVKQCAIEVCCADLARIGAVLANDGKDICTEQVIIPADIARICKTFMVTCGMYNASGEFAIRVGIPAKSGVSGGILAVVPGQGGVAVYGPALDDKGNSYAGVRLLASLSKRWNWSIF